MSLNKSEKIEVVKIETLDGPVFIVNERIAKLIEPYLRKSGINVKVYNSCHSGRGLFFFQNGS